MKGYRISNIDRERSELDFKIGKIYSLESTGLTWRCYKTVEACLNNATPLAATSRILEVEVSSSVDDIAEAPYFKAIALKPLREITIQEIFESGISTFRNEEKEAHKETPIASELDSQERPVLESVSRMTKLRDLSTPIVEWIRNIYGPNTEVHITWDRVQLKHDGIGIPFPIVDR